MSNNSSSKGPIIASIITGICSLIVGFGGGRLSGGENATLQAQYDTLASQYAVVSQENAALRTTAPAPKNPVKLFDITGKPQVENVYIYAVNNGWEEDKAVAVTQGFSFPNAWKNQDPPYKMNFNGETYDAGISLCVNPQKTASLSCELDGTYTRLEGYMYLPSWDDQRYIVRFYADGAPLDPLYTVEQGKLEKVRLDIAGCKTLRAEFTCPPNGASDYPDINLVNFTVS